MTPRLVRLVEAPDGATSRHYPVTVGRTYRVLDRDGSCLVVTTDEPGAAARIWRGRFRDEPPSAPEESP